MIPLSYFLGKTITAYFQEKLRSGACFYGTYELIMVKRTALSTFLSIKYMSGGFTALRPV
jgi:hypothetical protein